ncbi:hypothetical protein [uncultured Paracoccus sp.]|uniref:hypothetical protein n=1 Tax=uncultured Paracoccus sp. TaxID=189685 RepID=UPI0026026C44|nr:hypothetical protein [uncultured Paracoccus sp.]
MIPNILMSRNDGLGARLIPLLSALRLARLTGAKLRVYWPSQDQRTNVSQFSCLFAPEFSETYFIPETEFRARRVSVIPAHRFQQLTFEAFVQQADPASDYFIEEATGPIALLGEDPGEVARGYRAAMGLITFTDRVKEVMARIDAAFAGRQVTAYHIRHGDVTSSYRARGKAWPNKYVPPEIYLEHMRQSGVGQDRPALLISDTPASIDWLVERQPGAMRLSDLIQLEDLDSLQFDFLELYAMSRAALIVAPEMSGFSRVAAAIGAVPIADVGQSLTDEAMEQAMVAMQARLEEEPESFLNDGEIAQATVHLRRWLDRQDRAGDLSDMLDRQLDQGNTVPLLYRMRGEDAYRAGEIATLAETGRQARDAMIPLPHVLSEIDTMQALLHLRAGEAEAATPLLRRALYAWPMQAYAAEAVRLWLLADPRPSAPLYPFDPLVLDLIALSRGEPQKRVEMRSLVWETRHFLSNTFRGPLTAASADAELREKVLAVEAQDGIRGTAAERTLKSFRSQIELEGPDPESALALSGEMAHDAPLAENRWPAQRFALNLLHMRKYQRARYWFARLAKEWPDEPVYAGLLASTIMREGENEVALTQFERANPTGTMPYPVFIPKHVQLLDRLKRDEESEALYDRLLVETGWAEMHLTAVVRRALRQDRPFPHLDRLTRLADEAGPHRAAGALVAQLLFREGRTDEARARAQAALDGGGVPPGDLKAVQAVLGIAAAEPEETEPK